MPTADSSPSTITKSTANGRPTPQPSERIFVSPRVVDEQAFREYSGELRSLLNEVRTAQTELAEAGTQASTTAKNLSGSQDKYRQHLELTTKLLKALTTKSAEVEQLIAKVDERLASAKSIEDTVERTLETKINAFEASLEGRLAALESQYSHRIKELEEGFEAKRVALEQQIESQRVHVQTGLSAHADEIEAMLKERASTLTADIEQKLSAERSQAQQALSDLERQREAFASETGEPLQNTLEQLRTACDIASKLVGWNPADPSTDPDQPVAGSLGDLVRQASKTREDAEWSVRRLGSIRDQAQSMINDLGESIEGSISLFDQLHAQRAKLDGEVGSILDRAELTSAELKSRQSEIEELVSPLSESLKKAETVTRDLCSVADGAADLLTHAGIVHGDLQAVLTTAEQLIATLEPWRAVILESTQTSELPPAIAAIVERFEDEIGRDLAKMASAMQMIAERAETTLRPPKHPDESPEIVIRPRAEAVTPLESDQR
ncbi:MAG: hypothetical protein ACIAQF_02115 [Phycisphaerales bacterium JB065]